MLVALWLAYAASPFVGVCRLVEVVGQRDVLALPERVDFLALRGSLSTQIARTYLRITGKGGDPGSLKPLLTRLRLLSWLSLCHGAFA